MARAAVRGSHRSESFGRTSTNRHANSRPCPRERKGGASLASPASSPAAAKPGHPIRLGNRVARCLAAPIPKMRRGIPSPIQGYFTP